MCIIVAKEAGVSLPTKRTLKNCFDNNDDGVGFMYTKKGRVVISKGYMEFGAFYKALKEVKGMFGGDLTGVPMVFHFRIGTAGENSPQNTHPYPVTVDVEKMKLLRLTTDVGIVHNGIISDYNPTDKIDKLMDMNDTQCFIRDYVAELKNLNNSFYRSAFARKLILEESFENKFAILDGKGDIFTIGKFEIVNGVYYSNTSYEDDYWRYSKTYLYGGEDYSYGTTPYTSVDDFDIPCEDLTIEDFLSMEEMDIWDAIEEGTSLRYIDASCLKGQLYVGKKNGEFEELDNCDETIYLMDKDSNIYIMDNRCGYGLHLLYDNTDNEYQLFDSEYSEVYFNEL